MDIETATAVPRTPVSARITVRGHTLIQDKPAANGGNDEGVMASELLLASLLSCQLSTFAKVAAKRDAQVRVVSVRADLHFDDAGDMGRIEVFWTFEGGDAKERATLMRLTDRVCTISRALKCPVDYREDDEASAAWASSSNSR